MAIHESRRIGALLGLAAVVAGLAAAELVASLKSGLNNPVISLGNLIIDHVPVAMKEFAIRTLGINDESALAIGILLVVLLIAMTIGQTLFLEIRSVHLEL